MPETSTDPIDTARPGGTPTLDGGSPFLANRIAWAGNLSPAEWLFLLGAPVLAWWCFGIVLINQDSFIDPWFYTGYGQAFPAMHALFGWPYYAIRYPVLMLNEAFAWPDAVAGFATLRWLLLLSCGLPVYLWTRRRYSVPAAVFAYLFLFTNPLLPRILLWDLTTFIAIPFVVAGMMIWLGTSRRLAGGRFLAGFVWMAAIASHAFAGVAIGLFCILEAIRRLRARQYIALIGYDVLATALGAVACLLVGGVYYYLRIGPFDPVLLVTTMKNAVVAGNSYAGSHATPFAAWAATEYHIYVPLLCLGLSGVLLGRRIVDNSAEAGLWWFSLLYASIFAVYQFVFGRFVIETFYYFAHATVIVFVLVPVIVGELLQRVPAANRTRAALAGIVALLLVPGLNHLAILSADRLRTFATGSMAVLFALGVAMCTLVLAAWIARHRPRGTAAIVVAFALLVQTLTLLNSLHALTFDQRRWGRERDVYLAAVGMLSVFRTYARPDAQVMLWYCPQQVSLGSIASSVLLFTMHNPFVTDSGACQGKIGEYERNRLQAYPVGYVMMLDDNGQTFGTRDQSLRQAGYAVTPMFVQPLGGNDYHPTLRLVRISPDSK